MALKWDCLEAVAGVGLGAAACFAASNPMAAAAVVPAVAGAKLFGLLGQARERYGLESAKELERIRANVLAEWAHADPHAQFDVESADAALARLLKDAMPSAMTLGRLVATPDYPGEVVTLVLAQLARRDDRFGKDGDERRFAAVVIRAALEAALANQDYTKTLTVPMLIGLGGSMAAANEKLDRLVARAEVGFDPEEVKALQQFQAAVLQLAQLANDRADNPAAALAELRAMLRTVLGQRAKSEQSSNLGPWLDKMIKQVVAQNSAGCFVAGAQIITDTWEARQRERAERAEAERAADLEMCDFAIAQQRLVPGGAAMAAAWLQRKLAIEHGTAPLPFPVLSAAFLEWYERGEQFGAAFDLEVAIALCRSAGVRQEDAGSSSSLEMAWWQNNMGNALCILGARHNDTAALHAATSQYQEALTIFTREQRPIEWAAANNNLGNALWELGQREDDMALVRSAIATYRDSLTVYTREALPFNWATTQSNIGSALLTLGDRLDDIASVKDAVAAQQAALTVLTREDWQNDWATTQHNLGAALSLLGRRQDDPVALSGAIAAFREALTVRTREAFALDWALTQNNLAGALADLGPKLDDDPSTLHEAIAAYRAALTVCTQDSLPVYWAMIQYNLGNALRVLGAWEEELATIYSAIAVYSAALKVYTRDEMPFDWAKTLGNRALAHIYIAEIERTAQALPEAISDLESALKIFCHSGFAPYREKTEGHLARARALLAELGG